MITLKDVVLSLSYEDKRRCIQEFVKSEKTLVFSDESKLREVYRTYSEICSFDDATFQTEPFTAVKAIQIVNFIGFEAAKEKYL